MMSAEEDSDLADELPLMMVHDENISGFSRSSPQLGTARSGQPPSLPCDIEGKDGDDEAIDKKGIKHRSFNSVSGTHTPTQLEVSSKPETPRRKAASISPQKSASDLFSSENEADVFSVDENGLKSQSPPAALLTAQSDHLELLEVQQSGISTDTGHDVQAFLSTREEISDPHFNDHTCSEKSIMQSSMPGLRSSDALNMSMPITTNGNAPISHIEFTPVYDPCISSVSKDSSHQGYCNNMSDFKSGTTSQSQSALASNIACQMSAMTLNKQSKSLQPQDGSYLLGTTYPSHSQQNQSGYYLPSSMSPNVSVQQLFIPDMYAQTAVKQEQSQPFQYFVPSPASQWSSSQDGYSDKANNLVSGTCTHIAHAVSDFDHDHPSSSATAYPCNHSAQSREFGYSHGQPGFWEWVSNPVSWSEGAQKLKAGLKSATDKVLTTLDPGMEEYLKPVLNIGVASYNSSILIGIKHGCGNAFGAAVVKGHHASNSTAALPVGAASAIQGVNQLLDIVAYVNFGFSANYVLMAAQPFIMELTPGKDLPRNLVLHGFSQPICVPYDIVATAHNRSRHDTAGDFAGYDITIDEAVKIHIPYTKEQDWCCVLGGMPVHHFVSIAAQSLAFAYKRLTENGNFVATGLQENQQAYHHTNCVLQDCTATPTYYTCTPTPGTSLSMGHEIYELGL